MGCCQGKANFGAFKHELGAPLLEDLAPKLTRADDSRVFVVRLSSMKDIPIGDSFTSSTDSYAELKLVPNDPIAGMQRQISSIKPQSRSPKWEPPERFQFVVSNPKDARIIISLYHFNSINPKNSTPLGDGIIKLKDFSPTSPDTHRTIKLINPTSGKPSGDIDVLVSILTISEAMNIQEHCVYEFQRWNPINSWGATENFLPTDPKRWCSEDGSKQGDNIDDVAPLVPAGWTTSTNWHTVGTDHDPQGWQYSTVFESPYWYEKSESSYVVRRRTWHRTVQNTSQDRPSVDRASTSSTGTNGRRKRLF